MSYIATRFDVGDYHRNPAKQQNRSVLLLGFYMGGYARPITVKEVVFMQKTYSRGEMYYANLDKDIGSEQEGYCPVVIIQINVGNRFSPTVIIASISNKVGV